MMMQSIFRPLPAPWLVNDPDLALRPPVLAPVLLYQSLSLLYGPRGIGKSFFALGLARAVAAGESFLGWRARRPRKVIYIDGELAGIDLAQRVAALGPAPPSLGFLTQGFHRAALPDLGTQKGLMTLLGPWITEGPPLLLVIDSLSSTIGESRGAAERWAAARSCLLHLRAIGVAVLVVHHGTRNGEPRGAKHREDVFDLVLRLNRPAGYRPREGLRAEVHFEKARSLVGPDLDPFEVRMQTTPDGAAQWSRRPLGSAELHRVATLLGEGLNPNEIARKLGISKSKSYRLRERAMKLGL